MTPQPDDYEELECPKENTFKVGDLVRVYDFRVVQDGIISRLMGPNIHVDFKTDGEKGFSLSLHFKQCRPLKKKEPFTLWFSSLRNCRKDAKDRHDFCWTHSYLPPEKDQFNDWIKMQSSCDSCGKDFNK